MSRTPYTGVGSRSTPARIQKLIRGIAGKMESSGYVLRTGGAEGADEAFMKGAGVADIYVPWKGYNGYYPKQGDQNVIAGVNEEAREIASGVHPAWDRLSAGAKKLHARNVFQVLGRTLQSPSERLICWTPDGATEETTSETGGTGQAIRLANQHDIPVHNLANRPTRMSYQQWLAGDASV